MPDKIKPYRSSTLGSVPTLESGELAVNLADQKTYVGNGTSSVVVGAGKLASLGDVSASSPSSGQTLVWNGTAWANSSDSIIPAGAVMQFAGNVAPSGWIKANGAEISRVTYAGLWAWAQASGNLAASEGLKQAGQFGPGNGSTTFTIPDLRGEFVRGWDDSRGVDSGRGIGSAQSQNYQSHGHGVTDPGHVHTMFDQSGAAGSNGYANRYVAVTIVSNATGVKGTDTATTGVSIQSSGGTETRPRNVALLFCIKI